MPVRPMLLYRMALVSFRLFCKNLGKNLPVRIWDRLTFLNRHLIVSIG